MNTGHHELPEKDEQRARRIAWLIHAFIADTISETEHNELDDWVGASMKNQRLFEELTDPAFLEKSKQSIQTISDFLNPN
jgi:hypothetical protein